VALRQHEVNNYFQVIDFISQFPISHNYFLLIYCYKKRQQLQLLIYQILQKLYSTFFLSWNCYDTWNENLMEFRLDLFLH